jgi:GR25 family glycosyltransferase involved in LPS biosynthesis
MTSQISLKNLPIYVINLKRRPHMLKSFIKNNNKNFGTIIPFEAVDGLEYNNVLAKYQGPDSKVHQQTTHGRFGCFLSHLKLLKIIAETCNPDDWVLIAEDDAMIDPKLTEDWPEMQKPKDCDIIFLSRNYTEHDSTIRPYDKDEVNLVKIDGIFYGAHLYAVTGRGAKKILEFPEMDPYGSAPYDIALGIAAKRSGIIYATIDENGLAPYGHPSNEDSSSTEEYFSNADNYYLVKIIGICLVVIFTMTIYFKKY